MLPALDGTMPEFVINTPLTLYIEFHNVYFFLDITSQVDQVQSKMHAHHLVYLQKYKSRGKMHFHEKWKFCEICVQFH